MNTPTMNHDMMSSMHAKDFFTLSGAALVFSVIALAVSVWNFYVLGSWTEYWAINNEEVVTVLCEPFYETADTVIAQKAAQVGVDENSENVQSYPDVFYSEVLGTCVAYFTFYDAQNNPTDYVYDIETNTELSASDTTAVVQEFRDLYLVPETL